jgi:hypothetical protein
VVLCETKNKITQSYTEKAQRNTEGKSKFRQKNVIFAFWNKKNRNMDVAVEIAEVKTQSLTDEKQLYAVEEVFDRIDNKFIDFYGEYGRKIVNARRAEWNQDDVVNLKML